MFYIFKSNERIFEFFKNYDSYSFLNIQCKINDRMFGMIKNSMDIWIFKSKLTSINFRIF